MKTPLRFALAGLLAFSAGVKADVASDMSDMFGLMTNVTKPAATSTASRNVISGGSVSVRTPSFSPSLLNITPPSATAGCGGIDMHLGSFSFITKEQLVQLMKNIGSQAGSYAFSIALSQVCPTCMTEINNLSSTLNRIGQGLASSCGMIQQLAESKYPADQRQVYDWQAGTQALQSTNAFFQDTFSFAYASDGGATAELAADGGASMSEKEKELINKNFMWDALVKQSGSGADRVFMEQVMSLTGTAVLCTPGTEPGTSQCPPPREGEKGLEVRTYYPILKLSDIFYGNAGEALTLGGEPVPFEQFKCNDDHCLAPTTVKRSFKPLHQQVREALLGGGDGGSNGILAKRLYEGDPLTAKERGLISSMPDFVTMASNLAEMDGGQASAFVDAHAELLTLHMVYTYAKRLISDAMTMLGHSEYSGSDIAMQSARRALAQLHVDYRALEAEMQANNQNVIRNYLAILELRNRRIQPETNVGGGRGVIGEAADAGIAPATPTP